MGKLKHGFSRRGSSHPLYMTWCRMKKRCCDQKHAGYKNYGGRGITVCDEWKSDAKCFIEWASANGWKKGLYIDRIDNDGDYSPENCRFVDGGLSRRNTRLIYSDNKSGYRGVCFSENQREYISQITINGKQTYLGHFKDPIQAAIAYDSMAVVLNDGRPTNFRWPV